MPDPIATAFVRILPDLTGFRADLELQIKEQLVGFKGAKVAPLNLGIAPNITGATAVQKTSEQLAAAQVAVEKALKITLTTTKSVTEARAVQKVTNEALAKSETLLTGAIATNNQELERLLRNMVGNAQAADKFAADQLKEALAEEKRLAVTAEVADIQERLTAIDTAGADAASKKATASIRVTAASKLQRDVQAQLKLAIKEGDLELARELRLLQPLIVAKLEDAKATRAQIVATAEQAATTRQASRGALATLLSLAGARGATLAAGAPFLIGAAATVGIAKSVKAFGNFQTTLETFKATAGATDEQMKTVSETARKLGNDISLPAVSAADAATAMTELAKAGLSVAQSIAAARGVLQLATAAGIDNAEATQLVATALNAFSLQGSDAVKVADDFANAANAAQGSVSDFGAALEQSAAIAHQVGLSLEDTVTFLALFAKNGLRGSDAGTSLRTALVRLINPTKQANDLIDALGIHLRDAQGNLRTDVFAQFGAATKDLGSAFRDSAAATIFGQDAIRGATIAAREGTKGFAAMHAAIEQQGTAARVAGARTKGLEGSFEAAKNALDTLAIDFGKVLAPSIKLAVDAIIPLVNEIDKLINFTDRLGQFLDRIGASSNLNKKPVDNLADALKNLNGQALRPQDFGPFFQVLDKLQERFKPFERTQKIKSERIAGFFPVQEFIKGINSAIAAQQSINPQLAAGLKNVVAITKALHTIPSKQEIKFILTESLKTKGGATPQDILADLVAAGNKTAQAAQEGGKSLSENIIKGFTTDISGKNFIFDSIKKNTKQAASELTPTRINELAKGLETVLRSSVIKGGSTFTKQAADRARELIKELSKTAAGRAELEKVGEDFGNFIANGIKKSGGKTVEAVNQAFRDAVSAANQQLADAIKQANDQVSSAVISAKTNLGSLSGDVANSIAQVIDARTQAAIDALDRSPLAQELKRLQASLDKTNIADQRAQLTSAIGSATDEGTRRSAIAALNEFDLQNRRDTLQKQLDTEKSNLQKSAENQKKFINRQLADYANAFAEGKLSFTKFQQDILDILNKNHVSYKKAGELLGSAFKSGFQAQVAGLLAQAQALSGFLSLAPGGTNQVQITNVADVVKQSAIAVSQAKIQTQREIAAAKIARTKALNKQDTANGLLKDIRAAVRKSAGIPNGPETKPTTVKLRRSGTVIRVKPS